MTVKEIAATIRSKPNPSTILIGIEGFGGSGKTTFANELRDALGNSFVVSIDEFIVKEKITEPSWDNGGFDRDRLERQVLKPAKSGRSIHYQELLWESNTQANLKQFHQ